MPFPKMSEDRIECRKQLRDMIIRGVPDKEIHEVMQQEFKKEYRGRHDIHYARYDMKQKGILKKDGTPTAETSRRTGVPTTTSLHKKIPLTYKPKKVPAEAANGFIGELVAAREFVSRCGGTDQALEALGKYEQVANLFDK